MKAKLFLVILTLSLATLAPATAPAAPPDACTQWCWTVFCTGNQVCGSYTVNGQTHCGCHDPRPPFELELER